MNKSNCLYFLLIGIELLSAQGEVDNLASFQGFLGAVNTPNAEVLEEGEFSFLYTNQVENLQPNNSSFRENREEQNYFFNI